MSKKVVYARFHSVLHIPSFGQLEQVMPPSSKKIADLNMRTEEGGIVITATPPRGPGSLIAEPVTFLVPWANVQVAVYESEKAAPAVAKAS